jgi:hypothetical protein
MLYVRTRQGGAPYCHLVWDVQLATRRALELSSGLHSVVFSSASLAGLLYGSKLALESGPDVHMPCYAQA